MTEFIGPFETHHVAVDGFLVPCLTVMPHKGEADGLVDVVLDGRYSVTCEPDEAKKWIWIIANAMAIGAGYSSFGENSEVHNRYKTRIHCISGTGTEEKDGSEAC